MQCDVMSVERDVRNELRRARTLRQFVTQLTPLACVLYCSNCNTSALLFLSVVCFNLRLPLSLCVQEKRKEVLKFLGGEGVER